MSVIKSKTIAKVTMVKKKGARRALTRVLPKGTEPCLAWIFPKGSEDPILESEAHVALDDTTHPILILPYRQEHLFYKKTRAIITISTSFMEPVYASIMLDEKPLLAGDCIKYRCQADDHTDLENLYREMTLALANKKP